MPDEFVLSIDVGSSSVRASLFDARARSVPDMEARRACSVRATPDGGAEFDPMALLALVGEAIDDLLKKAGPRPIAAVACCTFWHSVMGADADGTPKTPLYTWADVRSEPMVALLRQRADEKAYHSRTGAFFHPLYLPAKLLWLGAKNAARWMSFGEWAFRRLFGRELCTISMASGTGLLDVHACEYDAATLKLVGLRPDQLSPLGDLKDVHRGLLEPYASRWPALKDVPWHPAVGDGACSNIGTGCVNPERIAVMIGTSGAMRVVWEKDRVEVPWGLWCYRIDRRRVVFGGALSEGGNLVDWCRHTLKLGAPEEVERELAALEPDAHGLTFLPFLAGERSPGWQAHARAVVAGLRLASKPVEILRAGMEAIALRFALIHELLKGAVPQVKQVWATGGALLSSLAWIQMLADAIGVPIVRCLEHEASSRGAAMLALEARGVLQRLEDVVPADCGTLAPDAARHQKYRQALVRQRHLYDLLIKI